MEVGEKLTSRSQRRNSRHNEEIKERRKREIVAGQWMVVVGGSTRAALSQYCFFPLHRNSCLDLFHGFCLAVVAAGYLGMNGLYSEERECVRILLFLSF